MKKKIEYTLGNISFNMVQIFLCGGTVDKTYFPDREVFDFSDTHIQDMIAQSRIAELEIKVSEVLQKDSLQMGEAGRKTICSACEHSPAEMIIIAHGTSTMSETAEYIQKHVSTKKTIVLFGSMYPFEHSKTDALFNFGAALSTVQILKSGVYIAMNGRIWEAGTVKKDAKRAVFMNKET